MSGISRMPRDSDPRRPLKTPDDARETTGNPPRSYGQYVDMSRQEQDDIEDFEDLTDEPVREGDDAPEGDAPSAGDRKKERQLREFEDLAGEPVVDEGEKKPDS